MVNTELNIHWSLFLIPPGFYELSDGGSYSLSNSCTSVYSECLSSSQTSLLLLPMNPATSPISPPSQADVCRRRSADESTTQPNHPRATGLHLGSSRIRASTTGTEQTRPRPVSTGNQNSSSLIQVFEVVIGTVQLLLRCSIFTLLHNNMPFH